MPCALSAAAHTAMPLAAWGRYSTRSPPGSNSILRVRRGAISRAASKFSTASRNASQRVTTPASAECSSISSSRNGFSPISLPKKRGYMESLTQPKFAR